MALPLLEDLVGWVLDSGRARLFVVDGSKALRKAVGKVFGSASLVQRCRNHKMRYRAAYHIWTDAARIP